MTIYNDSYRQYLHTAWEKFIRYEDYDYSGLRPEILDSWLRSRSYAVDPRTPKTSILSSEELNIRINTNLELIEIVRPYLQKLYSIVKGSGFYILLTDKDGYLLDLLGDRDVIEQGKKSFLIVGANRHENFAGTNAIGTSLALRKPIQIWGEEHYIEGHKKYVCSGAPIMDPDDNLIGCFNITGYRDNVHSHTLGMVVCAVDGISKELQMHRAYKELEMLSSQRNRILESMPTGLVLLNENNRIIQINSYALNMLHYNYPELIGRNFLELLSGGGSPLYSDPLNSEAYNKEVSLFNPTSDGAPLKLNMSVDFVKDGRGIKTGTLIRFNEPKKINTLVSRISGYSSTYTFDSIIGHSPAVQKMVALAKKAANVDSNVLILGESGTGKELIAQAIHNASSHAQGPFVAINCGALPKGLVESELFGYEKGSFTGANKDGNPGKFELADGGTIFLDEIGDMPLDVQISLLRVLQTKEVLRIGGKYPKKIEVHVIAATNRDLQAAIQEKSFREDLYYRLNVFTIFSPPLRERTGDVAVLAEYFVAMHNRQKNAHFSISNEVYEILSQYNWPGNIRELENVIERALNITETQRIDPVHLPQYLLHPQLTAQQPSAEAALSIGAPESSTAPWEAEDGQGPKVKVLECTEKALLENALKENGGNVKLTAERLGMSRRTLYRKIDKYKIPCEDFRGKA